MNSLGAVLELLDGVRRSGSGWSAKCPAHDDKNPSLSISEGSDGKVLLYCHAGCPVDAVVLALGLEAYDLFPPKENNGRRVVAEYSYRDETGVELSQVLRYEPKGFKQRRRQGDGWEWKQSDRRVPYRLPELIEGAKRGDTIYVSEGEKDVESIRSLGLTATCNAGGAGKWRPEFSVFFKDACVVVVADKDKAGREHAAAIEKSLRGKAASVRVVEVPVGKDSSEWIASGATKEDFEQLAASATGVTEATFAPSVTVCMADVQPESVSWLWSGRVPFGKVTLIDGDPGLGKSTLALEIAARLTTGRALPDGEVIGPENVVILTAEDGLADTVRPRLDAAEADVKRVFAFRAVRAANGEETFPTLDGNLPALADAVRRHSAKLVVVDPLMAFLGGSVNSYRDQDVRRVLAPLSKLAEETGAAVVVIRHLTKGGGTNSVYRGGGSIGIAGAARSVLVVAKDPEEDSRRIIASAKSNLSIPPLSLVYHVESAGRSSRLFFEGTSSLTANGLLEAAAADGEPEGRSARDEATAFLVDLLSRGPVSTPGVLKAAKTAGQSWATVRRAKAALGVTVEKVGMSGGWTWRLPAEDAQVGPKVLTSKERASSGEGEHLRENLPGLTRETPSLADVVEAEVVATKRRACL